MYCPDCGGKLIYEGWFPAIGPSSDTWRCVLCLMCWTDEDFKAIHKAELAQKEAK